MAENGLKERKKNQKIAFFVGNFFFVEAACPGIEFKYSQLIFKQVCFLWAGMETVDLLVLRCEITKAFLKIVCNEIYISCGCRFCMMEDPPTSYRMGHIKVEKKIQNKIQKYTRHDQTWLH